MCIWGSKKTNGSFSEDLAVDLINTDCLQLYLTINIQKTPNSYKKTLLVIKHDNSLEKLSMLDKLCEDKTKVWCSSKLD